MRIMISPRAGAPVVTGQRSAVLLSGSIGKGHDQLAESCADSLQALGWATHRLDAMQMLGKLADMGARQPRVRPFGYTERVPDLISAADLVITSSGDTCAEARTIGRPLLLLDVVQGHGRDNLQHELEIGDAMASSASAGDLSRCALAALDRIKPAPAGPVRSRASWETAFHGALAMIGC